MGTTSIKSPFSFNLVSQSSPKTSFITLSTPMIRRDPGSLLEKVSKYHMYSVWLIWNSVSCASIDYNFSNQKSKITSTITKTNNKKSTLLGIKMYLIFRAFSLSGFEVVRACCRRFKGVFFFTFLHFFLRY